MKEDKRRRRIIATILAVLVLLAGTYAWQSFSQEARNELKGELLNPGGRLHDHFDGTNKYAFIENYNLQDNKNENDDRGPIYVRMRIDEYLESGAGAGTGATSGVRTVRGDIRNPIFDTPIFRNKGTWDTFDLLGNYTSDIRKYWDITLVEDENAQRYYLPTFNKRYDNLDSDVNGTYLAGAQEEGINEPYSDAIDYSLGVNQDPVTDFAVYTYNQEDFDPEVYTPADELYIDEENGLYYVKETHTPVQTLEGAPMVSMAKWISMSQEDRVGDFWVCDVDGWAYWASALQPGTTTTSLFGGIEQLQNYSGTWYYANNVVAQMASAGDWGDRDGKTGFYGGLGITDNALALLNSISEMTAIIRLELVNQDLSSFATKDLVLGSSESLTMVADVKVSYSAASPEESAVDWTIVEEEKSNGTSSGLTQEELKAYLNNGVFTTGEALKGFTFVITATSVMDPSFSDSVRITVLEISELALTIAPGNGWEVIQPGESVRYVSEIIGWDEHEVEWSVTGTTSSDTKINAKTGLLVIGEDELKYTSTNGQKSLTVKATSTAYSHISATHRIYVRDWSALSEKIESVELGSNDMITIDGEQFYVLAEKEINGRNAVQIFAAEGQGSKRYSASIATNDYVRWSTSDLRLDYLPDWLSEMDTLKNNAVATTVYTGYYLTDYTEYIPDDDSEDDPVINEEHTETTVDKVYLLDYEQWSDLDNKKKWTLTTSTTNYWLRSPEGMKSVCYIGATSSIYTEYVVTTVTSGRHMRPTLWIYR